MRRPSPRKKRTPYTRNRVYSDQIAPRLHEQISDIQHGHRGFVAHWFKMKLVPANLGPHQTNVKGKQEFDRMLRAFGRMGSKMKNGDITRTGFVPRLRKADSRKINELEVPVTQGKFFDYMETVLSRGVGMRRWLRKKEKKNQSFRKPSSRELYERMHNRSTFNIGMNAILEVGKDMDGQPTHILVMRRPRTVPIEPEVHDFPAGLVRKGQSPVEAVTKRAAEEVGIKPESISLIGPDFKPTKEEIIFALQRLDRLANYNGVVIQRANVSAEHARENVERAIHEGRRTRNAWSPIGYYLIPRNPEAIRAFVRKYPTFMPEILRLYSFELSRITRKK